MVRISDFFKLVREISSPGLDNAGFMYFDIPEYEQSRGIFSREHLDSGLSGFVEFQLLTWTSPQAMQIIFFKNLGELPIFNPPPDYPPNGVWKIMTLPYLFGTIFTHIHPQIPDTGLWEFNSVDELRRQLSNATNVIMESGLPWFEFDQK